MDLRLGDQGFKELLALGSGDLSIEGLPDWRILILYD